MRFQAFVSDIFRKLTSGRSYFCIYHRSGEKVFTLTHALVCACTSLYICIDIICNLWNLVYFLISYILRILKVTREIKPFHPPVLWLHGFIFSYNLYLSYFMWSASLYHRFRYICNIVALQFFRNFAHIFYILFVGNYTWYILFVGNHTCSKTKFSFVESIPQSKLRC